MAWSAQKNQIFFLRAQKLANSIMNILEERNRLTDQYNNEAKPGGIDDPAFVDVPSICTKQELIDFATFIMNPMNNMMNNAAVLTRNRIPELTPLLTDQPS